MIHCLDNYDVYYGNSMFTYLCINQYLYVSVFTLYEYKNKLDGGKSNTAITTIENSAKRNFISGLEVPTGIPVPVEFGLVPVPVRYRFRSGTGRFGQYQTGTAIFFGACF